MKMRSSRLRGRSRSADDLRTGGDTQETGGRGGGGATSREEDHEPEDWILAFILHRSGGINLLLGDLPSAALVWKDLLFFSSGPVSPLGSLKLGGASTPTPTFLPPPLPHSTLLPTLPEVFLPGDPLSPAPPLWRTHLLLGGQKLFQLSRFKLDSNFPKTKA